MSDCSLFKYQYVFEIIQLFALKCICVFVFVSASVFAYVYMYVYLYSLHVYVNTAHHSSNDLKNLKPLDGTTIRKFHYEVTKILPGEIKTAGDTTC